ncbi:hypothetical protein [Ottowia sp. SB7-C50]|uniref:hypothetical protein n=1 Tax=Ottowia sp. SB7-C50 TaxID=3081231 RepID=UPI002955A1E4|nr:hypothetical protein [Ottowia sp. SB7-C50]WOP15713.1 hypothetical protein R0D99_01135 [Ottowia sp. SB7-C50]
MRPPITHPLPPAALRVLAITADAWGLSLCAPLPTIRTQPPRAPRAQAHAHAAHSTPADLRQWPYWPDYPSAAIGWR